MTQLRTNSSLTLVAACCLATMVALSTGSQAQQFHSNRNFAARRAADDSRPLARARASATSRRSDDSDASIVIGKFKAPAPERVFMQRLPKSTNFASQTLGASYRVSDEQDSEKTVHGILGASASQPRSVATGGQRQQPQSVQRTVSAKMQVSDDGLNYPPSKLSADIYGNVAEIVTAPPEAVENDFLIPQSNRFASNPKRRSY